MTLFVSAFLIFWYLVVQNRSQIKDIRFWKQLVYMVLVSAPLIIFAVMPYFSLFNEGGLPDRNLGIVRLYSASPTDFILPSTEHFLWGQWVGDNFNRDNWVEGTLYIGFISLILGIYALFQKKKFTHNKLISLMVGGAIFSMVLAMGIDFHWLSEPVTIPTPNFLQRWISRPDIPLLLPGYFLFQYCPI